MERGEARLAQEVELGTNRVVGGFEMISSAEVKQLTAKGVDRLLVAYRKETTGTTREPTVTWDPAKKRYVPMKERRQAFWLSAVEAPPDAP